MATKPSRAERNIAWIEQHCRIPEGRFVGQAVRLRGWQKDELRKIYDNPAGTRRALLSFGRKNAKTTLAAFLLLLHLAGPESRVNSGLYSAAQSKDQAAILFNLARKTVLLSASLKAVIVIRTTVKQLYCPERGTEYSALSADAETKFGLSPVFIVHDELGQVKGPLSDLYEALETATGAQDDPLSIIISTQARTDGDLLSMLLDDALEGHDPKTTVSIYTASLDLDPFSEEAIRQANPAYGDFLNEVEVRSMAENARRLPARENSYRNLVLNQRVEALDPFVTLSIWERNGDPVDDWADIYGALDLSEVRDLTCCLWASPVRGTLNIQPRFWLPGEGIEERSREDRVPYNVWHKAGWLHTTAGPTVDYGFVAEYVVAEIRRTKRVRKIVFDRWNFRHFRPWLLHHGLTEAEIDSIFVEFGQGFQSMSPALRTLEGLLVNGRVRHGNHPVMRMCATNAKVKTDDAGNRKLTKKGSNGRIDGMVCLAMVASACEEDLNAQNVFTVPLDDILAPA